MKKTMITALLVVLGLIILGGGIYGITTVLSDNTIVGPKGDVGPTGPEGPIGPTGERGSTIWKRDITSNGNETISIPTPAVHSMRVGDLLITTDNYVYRIYSITSSTITLTLEIAFNPPTPPEVPKWELLYSDFYYDDIPSTNDFIFTIESILDIDFNDFEYDYFFINIYDYDEYNNMILINSSSPSNIININSNFHYFQIGLELNIDAIYIEIYGIPS